MPKLAKPDKRPLPVTPKKSYMHPAYIDVNGKKYITDTEFDNAKLPKRLYGEAFLQWPAPRKMQMGESCSSVSEQSQ